MALVLPCDDPDVADIELRRYYAEGLEALPGLSGSFGTASDGSTQWASISATCVAEGGGRLRIGVHPGGGDTSSLRRWAPMNTWLAVLRATGRPAPTAGEAAPNPLAVEWEPATITVDGVAVDFEVCTFDNGWWAGIGKTAGLVLTLGSEGVDLGGLRLRHLDGPLPPPPQRVRPPEPAVRIPEHLLSADPPSTPDPATVVDLRGDDGSMTGRVGDIPVQLSLSVSGHTGTATGHLGSEAVEVTWRFSSGTGEDADQSAGLTGHMGDRPVALDATFRLEPGSMFDNGRVAGSLGDAALDVTVQRAGGGPNSSAVAVSGKVGDADVTLYAAVLGDYSGVTVRGTHLGLVHLDARRPTSE